MRRADGSGKAPPGVFVVWVAAGLIAAAYCWFRHPDGAIVEMLTYARFLAGITVYPATSPVAIGMAATATPAHGLLALLTAAGMSDRFLSLLLNIGTSALYAQAFALLCLGLTGRPLPSLAAGVAPVLAWAFVEGADYPVNTVNGPVLGNIAFALLLHALALAGCGRAIWSAVVVAVLGMMHPVYGALAVALGTASLLGARLWPGRLAAVMDWRALAAAGVAIAAAWATVRGLVPPVPELPPADPKWVEAYLDKWDYHRNVPVTPRSLGIALQALLATVAAALLVRRGPSARLGPAATTLAALLAAGGALGCLGWGLFHALRDVLPPLLVLPMPSRFLNLPEAAALALAVAGALAIRPAWGRRAALAALAVTAVGAAAATAGGWLPVPDIKNLERVVLIAVLLAGIAALIRRPADAAEPPAAGMAGVLDGRPARLAAAALLAAGLALPPFLRPPELEGEVLQLVEVVGRTGGMIVAQETLKPSFLPFRNPLLIDTNQMDLLPYVPRLIPVHAAILAEIYGIDFLDPPPASRRRGQVEGDLSRALWAGRSTQDWIAIGRRWNVRFILTRPDLRLPLNGMTMTDVAIWEIPR